MIVCGMWAGNPVPGIVSRALIGLLGGFVLGSLAGWIGAHIVRENAGAEARDAVKSPAADGVPSVSSAPGRATERAARQT